jgi:hypothetical protein
MSEGPGAIDLRRVEFQRVLQSESFRNSASLRRLLSYLAERSLNHTADELKEYVIGVDVFGKPPSYDPQKDASVRVQISRLRQKIDEYNKGEGSGEPYCLVLPKGHFTIRFEPRQSEAVPGSQQAHAARAGGGRFSQTQIGLAVTLFLLAASLLWTSVLWRKVGSMEASLSPAKSSQEFAAVWSAFLNPENPSVVVFGSPAFFASTSRDLFVRLYHPANPDDPRSSAGFADIDAKLGPLQGPRYDYASMGDAIGVQRLTAFLGTRGVQVRALPAHLAVWESIEGANLIFVGAARMNPLLRRLPIHQDFEFGPDDFIHNRNPRPGEQAVYETTSHRDSMSYAVVGSYAGLMPGREILLIAAHSTPATVGAVDFIASAEGVRVIREKLKLSPGEHRQFQVLLRIFTANDSPVKTEYVTHHLAP